MKTILISLFALAACAPPCVPVCEGAVPNTQVCAVAGAQVDCASFAIAYNDAIASFGQLDDPRMSAPMPQWSFYVEDHETLGDLHEQRGLTTVIYDGPRFVSGYTEIGNGKVSWLKGRGDLRLSSLAHEIAHVLQRGASVPGEGPDIGTADQHRGWDAPAGIDARVEKLIRNALVEITSQ